MTVTRFAPSPTGFLHVGNLRAALFSWAVARKAGGTFILRLDDTDRDRSTDAFAAAVREDLGWLGLDPDREERQSARLDRYRAAADRLQQEGRLYEAFETEAELALRRRAARAAGRPPVYDRAALGLTAAERARLRAERRPHWRFRLSGDRVGWQDGILGAQSADTGSLSDPVLIRADGRVLYSLASVVDDIEMGVTDVIRGADHVTNSAVQIEIFRALGAEPPRLAHHPLLLARGGTALSKRDGAVSIRDLRAGGIEALALLSLLARLGSADPVVPFASHAELVAGFALGRFGAAPTVFDPHDLAGLNAKLLQRLPHAAVAARLREAGIPDASAPGFWDAVRGNLAILSEVRDWWTICAGRAESVVEEPDRAFVAEALRLLPPKPWTETTWQAWTGAVAAATGRRGKALYQPLRRALTGRDHGPEMARLMPFLGPG
jgi:glutamyl-tRNA synthetase